MAIDIASLVDYWFHQYTFTFNDVLAIALYTIAILVLFFTLCRTQFYDNDKKLAWAIGLLASFFMTIVGAVYLYVMIPLSEFWNFFNPAPMRHFHAVNNFNVLVATAFATSNAVDLVVGMLCYRKQLGLLTTFIHHPLYIWMMHFAVTSNGFFLTVPTPFAACFILSGLEELPTFLLALGTMYPAYRTDIGFGVTFFLFRILLHGYYVYSYYIGGGHTTVVVLYSITFAMHLQWFYGWVTKYGSKLLGGGKKTSKKAA